MIVDIQNLITTLVVQTVVIAGVIISAYINLIRGHGALSERVKVLEVTLDSFGRTAAKRLHSPHDPYGIDNILDKYLDRNYELSYAEWEELLDRCREIENRADIDKEQKFLAGMLEAVCMHKLFMPPPKRTEVQ